MNKKSETVLAVVQILLILTAKHLTKPRDPILETEHLLALWFYELDQVRQPLQNSFICAKALVGMEEPQGGEGSGGIRNSSRL